MTHFDGAVRNLNNAGQVVGFSETASYEVRHARLWTVPSANCLAAPNLVANAGFEEDTNGDGQPDTWSGNTRFTRSGNVVHTGSFAGKHAATDNGWYTISQSVNQLTANVPYQVSGWVNIPPTSAWFSLTLRVQWRNALGWPIGSSTIRTDTGATDGWEAVTANLVAPTGTTSAQIQMVVHSLDATIYVDELTFSYGAASSPADAIVATKETPSEATEETPSDNAP